MKWKTFDRVMCVYGIILFTLLGATVKDQGVDMLCIIIIGLNLIGLYQVNRK